MSRQVESNKDGHAYAVITNIPDSFHSSDLRRFFSTLIELKRFLCFHFRHRPEVYERKGTKETISGTKTCCCVVKMPNEFLPDLIAMYNRKHWTDADGNPLPTVCIIKKIKVDSPASSGATTSTSTSSSSATSYLSRRDKKLLKAAPPDEEEEEEEESSSRVFAFAELFDLKELRPPAGMMPRGNVGTPTDFYLDKIRRCSLPTKLISQLGLEFPKSKGNRKYSNVPPPAMGWGKKREGEVVEEEDEEEEVTLRSSDDSSIQNPVRDGRGHVLLGEGEASTRTEKTKPDEEEEEEEEESGEEDNSTEEWERHEALHDDVTAQGRCKERLFEEPIELKWEKGGSGLVFYTDAQFWKEQEGENDFDTETADDWDVDTAVYYERGGGDRDARDAADVRREEKLRRGSGDLSGLKSRRRCLGGAEATFREEKRTFDDERSIIGRFEKYTKGFGRRLMEKQGWTDGRGLGTGKNEGTADALEGDGQAPSNKAGLGFREEMMLNGNGNLFFGNKFGIQRRCVLEGEEKRARKRKLFDGAETEDLYVLPTKYDKPEEVNERDNVLRSAVPQSNKSHSWKR